MRIACIHIPQIALQCATRIDPALRGAAVAVVGAGRPQHSPVVTACSRAAHALGVRAGMTAMVARELGATIATAEASTERETAHAIADALLAIAPRVDLGGRINGHLALYAEVPAKTRGHAFGERAIDLVEQLGITARVGVADDRFAAWVAAAHGGDEAVITVPRGGSAAFLAPRPLALLAIAPEVQHMLEALGVRTLGAFAALPAPSVARPGDADYQALARGDAGATLSAYAPDAPIREDIAASAVLARDGELDAGTAIALLAGRIALRLAGRGRVAATLDIAVGGGQALAVALPRATADAADLARAIAPALRDAGGRVRVTVTGEVVVGEEPAIELAPAPTLAVVLATPGAVDLFTGAVWPQPITRAPRRTRRGKQRRQRAGDRERQSRLDLAVGK